MAAPAPPKGAVPMTSAGPFLRYNNIDPATHTWTGSCLFLTREPQFQALELGDAGAVDPPLNGGTAGPGAGPTLSLVDDGQRREVQPVLLAVERGWSFYRYNLELSLGHGQRPVQYRIGGNGSAGGALGPFTFWLPGADQPLHWGYYSCSGISGDVPEDAPQRVDPTYLWRDVTQLHAAFPLHAMIGGGDQLYNDPVWKLPALKAWSQLETSDEKEGAVWTPDLDDAVDDFYLSNYLKAFTLPDVAEAYAAIPQVNVWDDHDIFDGYGSYEPKMQNCTVFQGLFAAAKRYYLLFQQQTTVEHAREGAQEFLDIEGEYHSLKYFGPTVSVLAIDMRSRRKQDEIMPRATYDVLRATAMALPPRTQHLVVLSGVPLVFPKVPGAESVLGCLLYCSKNSRVLRHLQRSAGVIDRFNQPEILDDLTDGWAASVHAEERGRFIRLLQDVALAKGVRVSILSGDAHVGGVGRLYSRPKVKDLSNDPLFMPQIISSAIMNAPPPHPVVRMLIRTNAARNVDGRTREKMVRAFWPRHPRTDKLLGRRNWCDVSVALPPFAPPMNPASPKFGGMRFTLRVEDPHNRRGYAEETYCIEVPRPPAGQVSAAPLGAGRSGLGAAAQPPASPLA